MRRAVFSALVALALPAQDTAITHASIRLAVKPEPAIRVTLVNRRASPLTDIQIRMFPKDAGRGIMTHRSFQPLDAHAERTFDLRTDGAIIDHASVTLAVFEDGYCEGAPDAIAEWKKERQAAIGDLVYWIGVLSTMPRVSEPDLRRFLAQHIVAHTDTPQGRKETMRARIRRILENYPSGPDVWLPLDGLKQEAQTDLAALRRQPPAPDAAR